MPDLIDHASDAEERHRAAALAAQRARAAALPSSPGRVDCANCGRPIHPLLLSAVPDARRCAPCQAIAEAAHVV